MHEFIVECFKKTFVKKYFRDELGICQVYFFHICQKPENKYSCIRGSQVLHVE